MSFSVCFIERRDRCSPSIERVFRSVAAEIEKKGASTMFARVPFGNGPVGIALNLLFFRPPKADLYHITGHVNFLGLVLPRNRTILTVHDLTILDHRSGPRGWLIRKLFFVWPLRRLKHLSTISNATKDKVVDTAHTPPARIRVIENPLLVSKSLQRPFNSDRPTVLQIGTAPNKNVERLVEAIGDMKCRLHVVGKLPPHLRKRIGELEIEVVNDEYLDDEAIERAYENADIVTLCSTDEGFGLPIIEAQAKRTPVVTSDRAPMKEVAGDGAVLVDPDDIDSIRGGLRRIVDDTSLRTHLILAGDANLQRFEAAAIGTKYFNLYEQILNDLK